MFLLSDHSSDCVHSVLGLIPLDSACEPLALLIPVPGDVHVFVLCGWENYIPLGGQGAPTAAV